jgi:TBC1 domain family member 14
MISANRLSQKIINDVEEDIEDTFRNLKLFQRDGIMYQDLKDLLLSYSVFWKDKPSYVSLSYDPAVVIVSTCF